MTALNSRQRRIVAVLRSASRPLTVAEVSAALNDNGYQKVELNRGSMRVMVLAGILTKTGNYNKVYALTSNADESIDALASVEQKTRGVVSGVLAQGLAKITNLDVAIEVEAEKVWTLASVIRVANTARGADMGIDADVREARALIAEARRQVRDDTSMDAHCRDSKFDGATA